MGDPTYTDARRALLEVLNAIENSQDKSFGREHAIKEAATRLGQWGDRQNGRLLMDAWDDLFRAGVIGYGLNMSNLGFNFAHLTAHGRETIKNVDRDPANPSGYLNVIKPHVQEQPIALSYLAEALETYNKGNVKASAVMLGCAAEALSLSLRDRLKAKIIANGGTAPAGLDDWRFAVVLRTLESQLSQRAAAMPRELRERFESYWPAWTGLFRMTRNDAGHPKSIEPVVLDAVHGALLLFHEQARLTFDLAVWTDTTF